MALKGYPYNYQGVGKKKQLPLLREHKYSFKNRFNFQYIVNVEEYQHEVYIVKFHLAAHALSKWRYCLMTNQQDARRIIYTCVDIGKELHAEFPYASFGFIGNPTKPEIKKKKFFETKRYRVYQNFAKFFFDPELFEHAYNTEKSTYILLNKKNKERHPNLLKSIVKMFQDHYDIDNIYSNLVFELSNEDKK